MPRIFPAIWASLGFNLLRKLSRVRLWHGDADGRRGGGKDDGGSGIIIVSLSILVGNGSF